MSMSGERRLELERERLEALRLEQVRQECTAIVDTCDEALRSVRDVAVQQLAANALRDSASALRALRAQIATSPDLTRSELLRVSEQMHVAIADAEANAQAWTAEQARAVALARSAQVMATANGDASSADAVALGRRAVEEAERGDVASALQLAQSTRDACAAASNSALDERVRREVVKGLLKTLKEMGFVTVGPQLDAGTVILEGRLASGRKARFEVNLDGTMEFDLDGYEGRSCADDMEKVETTLRDRFGVKLGPPQIVWKNPDRISKGARDLPTGASRKK